MLSLSPCIGISPRSIFRCFFRREPIRLRNAGPNTWNRRLETADISSFSTQGCRSIATHMKLPGAYSSSMTITGLLIVGRLSILGTLRGPSTLPASLRTPRLDSESDSMDTRTHHQEWELPLRYSPNLPETLGIPGESRLASCSLSDFSRIISFVSLLSDQRY